MIKEFLNWFWSFFADIKALEELSPAEEAILELLPLVFGVIILVGFFVFMAAMRKSPEEEELEEIAPTALDKEIEEVKNLQRKSLW